MLTSKQRSNLKSIAANLQPIGQCGKGGVNENMIASFSEALEARELIKINVLENAEEGDSIIFAKGVYKLNLLLTEPLAIRGEDGAVIDAGGKGSGITIRRSRTTVENLTIKNYGGDLYKRDSGVRVMDGCTGVKLTNLKLFGSGFGIRADRLDNLEIRDCEITGNSRRHILDRGDGVFLNYVKHSKLINNKVKNVPSIGCTPAMTSATTT